MKRIITALAALAMLLPAAPAHASATRIGCSYWGGTGNSWSGIGAIRPSRCWLAYDPGGGYGLSNAESIYLRKIRWSSWGGSVARARAVFRTKLYEKFHPVRVRAFRRVSGGQDCGTEAYYTRVRVFFPNGNAHTWVTPGCWLLPGH